MGNIFDQINPQGRKANIFDQLNPPNKPKPTMRETVQGSLSGSDDYFKSQYEDEPSISFNPLSGFVGGSSKVSQMIAQEPEVMRDRLVTGMTAGLPAVAGGVRGEEALETLPMTGQILGSRFGMRGAVGGAMLGEAGRRLGRTAFYGDDLSGFAKGVGKEGLTTGMTEGVFRGAGKIAKAVAPRLMTSVLKPIKAELTKGKNLGQRALEEGFFGTKGMMFRKASSNVSKYEDKLQDILTKSKKQADISSVYGDLDKLKKNYFGNSASLNAIEDMKNSIASEFKQFGQYGRLPVAKVNELKRSLYSQAKPSQFGTSEAPHLANIRKTAARSMKEAIERVEPGVKNINKKIGTSAAVRDSIENRLYQQAKREILPYISTGAGAAGIMYGKPEIAFLAAGLHALRSDTSKATIAQLMNQSKKFGEPVTKATSEMIRRFSRG